MRDSTRIRLLNNLPEPRFRTYLEEAGDNIDRALALYQWNIEAAAAVLSTLSIVEVALRDTIDRKLRKWNLCHGGTAEWIVNPQVPLSHIVRETPPHSWSQNRRRRYGDLYHKWWEAKARNGMRDVLGRPVNHHPTHDDLVASLTFGMWRHLIPKPVKLGGRANGPQVDIWNQAISYGTELFPEGRGFNASPGTAYFWCSTLNYARNRAAHLEPLLDVKLLWHWHRVASRTLRALWPGTEVWITGPARIPEVIRNKPK